MINKRIELLIQSFKTDSLLRNAVFLMASTGIMGVLGFGFWLFIARLYTPHEIGEASALIAISLLLSNLSFFGLNSALVRFLPTSKNQSRDINATLVTVSISTLAAGAIYLAFAPHYGGQLSALFSSVWSQFLFMLLMVAVALNTLTDSIFIANRRTEFHTIVYAVFGLVKLILPLFLIKLGSLGIFIAYITAAIVSLILTFYFMKRITGYRFWSKPNWAFISNSRKYTANNYIATLLAGLPSQLMPTLILIKLHEADVAYFAMAWTMANLLYVIPLAIMNSLIAETSHNVLNQNKNMHHAIRILILMLVPIVSLAIIIAPYLLHLFGAEYSKNGTTIFQLLAISTFFLTGNALGTTIMNIEHRTGGIVITQFVISLTTLVLAWFLLGIGLKGVGIAILFGNIAGCVSQIMQFKIQRKKPSGTVGKDGESAVYEAVASS